MTVSMGTATIPAEVRDLLERWVSAIQNKDLEALSGVFREKDAVAFWSNGERNVGWDEIRRHIESDFKKDVDLRMEIGDLCWVPLGAEAAVLSYRYDITLALDEDTVTFHRRATMAVHRGDGGWRVASLHVSTA